MLFSRTMLRSTVEDLLHHGSFVGGPQPQLFIDQHPPVPSPSPRPPATSFLGFLPPRPVRRAPVANPAYSSPYDDDFPVDDYAAYRMRHRPKRKKLAKRRVGGEHTGDGGGEHAGDGGGNGCWCR